MFYIPPDPGGQRTVLIILVHGGEVPPLGIAAGNFGDAGFEIDAEPFPQKQKDAGAHGRALRSEARAKSWRREKEGDKAGFEEHAVGLVAGKIRGGADEREEADQTDDEHGPGEEADVEKDGGKETDPTQGNEDC